MSALAHPRAFTKPRRSRNTGIAESTGRFIAFLDSDDSWAADKLERQVLAMSYASENVKACCTGYHLYKANRHFTIRLQLDAAKFRSDILFGCAISPGTTLMIERSAFDQVGPYDETLRRLEDWDWMLRFAQRFDVLVLPDPLATVYFNSTMNRRIADKEDPVLLALKQIEAKHLHRLSADRNMASRFRSTILFEAAAQMYRKNRFGRAAQYVLMSLWIYPFRNVAFYRTMWRALVSAASRH
jgi:glycosyltransferase involved in cell wall biosynthesis